VGVGWASPPPTAGVQLPIEPVPRVVVTTGAFPGLPKRRTLVIDAGSSFYFHREGDGVLMGMGGHDVASFDTTVDERFVNEELVPRAVAVYPPLADAGIHSRWAGLYEMTPDRLPVVGPAPVDGLWIAAGFSGHGFQHGPIVGKVVAESIMGAPASLDVSALSLNRFGAGDLTSERHVV
jgi:sarcosine oxidase, subunit beta